MSVISVLSFVSLYFIMDNFYWFTFQLTNYILAMSNLLLNPPTDF